MPATLTFNDDFNSLSLWNGSSGTWDTTFAFRPWNGNGGSLPSNGEQEWYINANYGPTASVTPWTVSGGILTLTAARVDPSIAPLLGYTDPGLPAMGSYQFTSGMIETNHSFSQTYGYFEMRAELPAGQGFWPAFWLMPQDGSWPPELDVMEVMGNDPTTLYTTVHTAQTGSHTSSGVGSVVADMSKGFHTFAVDWEADKITWYFDGKPVYQVATPADMNKPMYMIANLALGGDWAGYPDATTPFPAVYAIDYIRAYRFAQ
jgi:beta-glucanase (GH16 family)